MPEKTDVKPNPALQNEVFVKEVRRLVPRVKWTEEKPVLKEKISTDDGAGTFYTFSMGNKGAVAEWRAKSGFGIALSKDVSQEPVVMNPYIAARRISELLA